MALKWITGCGGPLLLLAAEWIEAWEGVDPPSGGRVVRLADADKRLIPEAPASDYDRACEIEEPLANLEVGNGRGIVIGGEPDPVCHWQRDGRHFLVRWVRAESEGAILEHLAGADLEKSEPMSWIEASPGPLVLFDAAVPGGEIEEDCVQIDVHPGLYVASVSRLEPDEEIELVLIELAPAG